MRPFRLLTRLNYYLSNSKVIESGILKYSTYWSVIESSHIIPNIPKVCSIFIVSNILKFNLKDFLRNSGFQRYRVDFTQLMGKKMKSLFVLVYEVWQLSFVNLPIKTSKSSFTISPFNYTQRF